MKVQLPELHAKQKQIIKEAKRFNVLNCGRRFGKTVIAENLLSEPALDGIPVAYFAPTYKLLAEVWRSMCFRLHNVTASKSSTEKQLRLITGGLIDFWTLDDPNAGRGRKYGRAVLDEVAAARYLEEAWQQSIRPTLTDMKGDAWFMSTPKGPNFYKTLYIYGQTKPDWVSWTMPTSANPYISKSEIEAARDELPELIFNQEYLAEFSESEMNPFGYDYLDACAQDQLSTEPTVCYGVDVAFKQDWTVIIGEDKAGKMSYYDRFQRPLPETQRRIKEVIGKSPAYMDSTGLGQPIYQELRNECLHLEGLSYTSGKGDNSKYRLINGLINAVQKGECGILSGYVMDEHKNFTYSYSPSGNITYEAPSGLHDDAVNARALCRKAKEELSFVHKVYIG